MLNQEIADCSPDVIIIHGGSVFNQVPGAYRGMIIGLKKQHPDLPFALEGKHEWLTRWPRSTYALLERKGAHIDDDELAYWVNHNFIDDDEVDKIIKVIFL